MLFGSYFKDKKHRKELLLQASQRARELEAKKRTLDETRARKLERQVELWTIQRLGEDMEEEYFTVSHELADLIKQIAAISEYLEDLGGAYTACEKSKESAELERLLAIADPWAEKIRLGTQDAVPRIAV